ncbi:MAG: PEPxxWA-CTERM sorting domain-containing protein [Candidatus Sphingomonas colombiensis]|nr:PEPxxWA-CTERM sorting domain-containing protein [Sphingomonas sp.]WEK44119.1 MAG: PEPxxWA-CTERM sorting domain-containing protein [Sphingomonas sp.]
MAWFCGIWRAPLVAAALLSSPTVSAKVVYLSPVSLRESAEDELPGTDTRMETSTVWNDMEDAARSAAARAGMGNRVPTPQANSAIFAQALASRFDLPNEVSLSRLLDFRVPANPDGQDEEKTERRSLVAIFLASDVPEPATWLSLICGFGVIGAMLRRRRLTGREPVRSPALR